MYTKCLSRENVLRLDTCAIYGHFGLTLRYERRKIRGHTFYNLSTGS